MKLTNMQSAISKEMTWAREAVTSVAVCSSHTCSIPGPWDGSKVSSVAKLSDLSHPTHYVTTPTCHLQLS